ncbi:hypothetical protein ZHAS_00010335 [Anopheles sinensis]|uniref:Uncharacterized protein n=1 Tax=Anopheles sinensis TaxID=74873 RepID=A0A084VXC0_ANOSI|nr:hypothetical protein ZHAS_00010335 [Anopheles sinensis]
MERKERETKMMILFGLPTRPKHLPGQTCRYLNLKSIFANVLRPEPSRQATLPTRRGHGSAGTGVFVFRQTTTPTLWPALKEKSTIATQHQHRLTPTLRSQDLLGQFWLPEDEQDRVASGFECAVAMVSFSKPLDVTWR